MELEEDKRVISNTQTSRITITPTEAGWKFPTWNSFAGHMAPYIKKGWPKGTLVANLWESDSEDSVQCFIVFNPSCINNLEPNDPQNSLLANLGVSGSSEIFFLQTNPTYLRLGCATKLLSHIFKTYPNFIWFLDTDYDLPAQNLYNKHGFSWFGKSVTGCTLIKSPVSMLAVCKALYENDENEDLIKGLMAGYVWDPKENQFV